MVSEASHTRGGLCAHCSTLVAAAKAGNASLAQQLLIDGKYVHVDERDERIGGTALSWTASWGDLELARLLLARGAGIDARNKRQATPLHVAVDRGRETVVKLLISRGAQLDAQTDTLDTACHLAAYRRKPELLRLLISAGSDLSLRNNKSKTALHVALASHCPHTIRVFTEMAQKRLSSSSFMPDIAKPKEEITEKKPAASGPPVESVKPDMAVVQPSFSLPRRPEQHADTEGQPEQKGNHPADEKKRPHTNRPADIVAPKPRPQSEQHLPTERYVEYAHAQPRSHSEEFAHAQPCSHSEEFARAQPRSHNEEFARAQPCSHSEEFARAQPCSHSEHYPHVERPTVLERQTRAHPHAHTERQADREGFARFQHYTQPELQAPIASYCRHYPDRQSHPPNRENGCYWSQPETCYSRPIARKCCCLSQHEHGCYRQHAEFHFYPSQSDHRCYRSNPEQGFRRPQQQFYNPSPIVDTYHSSPKVMPSRPELLRRSLSHHAPSRRSQVVSMMPWTPDSSLDQPESFLYRSCSDDTMIATNALGLMAAPKQSSSPSPDNKLYNIIC